ncbi:protein unc-50 homolog [Limulus polyphemus]|uniref:Protein unc-50 homolog n=1 Tax=Limulus polyphemus TaxID=6850 RepID=A0ABM1TMW0_LIMPO|nr:protein unc-50 homolog [Limulus polyphemus]
MISFTQAEGSSDLLAILLLLEDLDQDDVDLNGFSSPSSVVQACSQEVEAPRPQSPFFDSISYICCVLSLSPMSFDPAAPSSEFLSFSLSPDIGAHDKCFVDQLHALVKHGRQCPLTITIFLAIWLCEKSRYKFIQASRCISRGNEVCTERDIKIFLYRKQTKDQFARDDPAFLVLLSVWLIVSRIPYVTKWWHIKDRRRAYKKKASARYSISWSLSTCLVLLTSVAVRSKDVGLLCSCCNVLRFFSNHYLRKSTCQELDVEWGYAFDVHLNAFFPLLIILHFFQLFFYHVLIRHDWFISRLFGNTLWFIAVGYYIYITFLGYSALPILKKTRLFLYPMTVTFFLYLLTLICGWNLCHLLINFYHYRVM